MGALPVTIETERELAGLSAGSHGQRIRVLPATVLL